MKELNVRDFEEFQNNARKFVDGFSRFYNNRRVFGSEAGGLGWRPDPMRGGDVVCVLNGMDMPFVVRKLGEAFVVIGNVYVHGIMDGEAMDAGKEEEIPLI
jgi:hypothetical protein